MPQLAPYLNFDGTCAEAMRFYERTLGGTLTVMPFRDSPMASQVPPEALDRVLHARLELPGGQTVLASDHSLAAPFPGMHGFGLSLSYDDVDEGRRVFEALAAGGQVQMPFDKTFWAKGFGMLVDRYGTPWMVNVE